MENKKEIFFCYAREDEKLRIELEKQLNILKRQGFINFWHDREISAGKEWEREIDAHLNTAHIILLLVSPDFMVSDYCYSKEMKRAMERHEAGEACVIPVILRPVIWRKAPFGKLQALPTDGKPVVSTLGHSLDEGFYDVAEGIRKAVEEMSISPLVVPAKNRAERSQLEQKDDPPIIHQSAQTSTNAAGREYFDACLSYSAADAVWTENLVKRLRDEYGFRIWLDKWLFLPGQPWQQARADDIDQASCCIICLSEQTPISWFKQEIQRALDRQSKDPSFRVIPTLLPNAKTVNIGDFPELRIWLDFRGAEQAYTFYALACGIRGVPPGRWPPRKAGGSKDHAHFNVSL
jgi:hypothetical protein